MKKYPFFMCALYFWAVSSLAAQVKVRSPKKTVERKVENRANNRIDRSIDRGLDKVEEGVGNIFRKKEDRPAETKSDGKDSAPALPDATQEKTTKTDVQAPQAGSKTFAAYGKFDFVAGEKIIAFEDFTQDAIGDFPAKWNTNGSAEVVTLEGETGKWLQLSRKTRVLPDFITHLPDNFTLEFDLLCNPGFSFYSTSLDILLVGLKNRKDSKEQFYHLPFAGRSGVRIGLDPTDADKRSGKVTVKCYEAGKEFIGNSLNTSQFVAHHNLTKVHVSLWRQKQRLRVYLNEDKVMDVPRALSGPVSGYNAIMFEVGSFSNEQDRYLISNLRLAVGEPDTRNKLLTEGRFSTSGILFDVNSDQIQPASYGVLKEIGTVLAENPTLKVKIIGHTDADGEAAANLSLSRKRADAVREVLSRDFGISTDRMRVDGKGETQPLGSNATSEGKAMNRRVEFIKW
jgi:outer membrane protein OmpA-like peptidoglycan-associated protein